jgi:ubiquitin-protein ligase
MLTPVFHPNIDPQKICIGDHWSAGQSLADMVVRIAEMICYQSYNTKSPLNAEAAAWAEQNEAQLPLFRGDLSAVVSTSTS